MKIGIVGAGPAGSLLAYRLGKGGLKVSLYDKHDQWEKPCGGGVTSKVINHFPEVAKSPVPCCEAFSGSFISPAGRQLVIKRDRPIRIYSRRLLDGYLRSLALAEKSVTFKQKRVIGVEPESKGGYKIITDRTREKVDLVIGADGALSRVRRSVAAPIPKSDLAITGGYFVKVAGVDEIRMEFLPEGGYLWSFPRTDHVCIGGGAAKRLPDLFGALDRFREKLFPEAPIISKWGAPIPFIKELSFYDLPTSGKGWAVVGDAAGHVDAISGEGIYYALRGAELLAEAVLAQKLENYEQAWRDVYGPALKQSTRLSRLFYSDLFLEGIFVSYNVRSAIDKGIRKISPELADRLQIDSLFHLPGLKTAMKVVKWLSK